MEHAASVLLWFLDASMYTPAAFGLLAHLPSYFTTYFSPGPEVFFLPLDAELIARFSNSLPHGVS